jgi:hypothetical protein
MSTAFLQVPGIDQQRFAFLVPKQLGNESLNSAFVALRSSARIRLGNSPVSRTLSERDRIMA